MGIGDVVVLDEIRTSLNPAALLEQPPFSRWTSSRSGEVMATSVNRLVEPVIDAIDPRGMYRITPTRESEIHSYDPPAALIEGEYVLAGVLTLGEVEPSNGVIASRFERLVWDAIENAALQNARETIIEAIRSQTEELQYNTTSVFAPGTRDDTWALERRQYMFDELPTTEIGVSLGSNGKIEPQKTFTFAMGVGPEIEQAEMLISCADCEIVEDCVYAGSATIA